MSFFDICEIAQTAQLLGIPFNRAMALHQEMERMLPAMPTRKQLPALIPSRAPFIGELEVVL